MRPKLRTGVADRTSLIGLTNAAAEGRNVASGAAGRDWRRQQAEYLAWVKTAESALQNVFDDAWVWRELHSEYFWRIRELGDGSPRASELISDEVRRQADRLDGLRQQTDAFLGRVHDAEGTMAVLDTHVLLHFVPPSQVDWLTVVGAKSVRLVVPLRVVEELDEKKYTGRDDVAGRARRVIAALRRLVGPTGGRPAPVREQTTVEVWLDDEPRRRGADADQEVLDCCTELVAAGADLRLVTDDAGLDIRARAAGVAVVALPEKYLRQRPPERAAKSAR